MPEPPPHRPIQIGRYLVEAKIGEGGMAETWLCHLQGARGFTKRFVVKTLKPECRNSEYETMFTDEARIGARLDHPHIAEVIEFGEANGVLFIVQEYVEGPGVHQILQRQRARGHFDLRMGCRIVADIASALDHAYNAIGENGQPLAVIHRDISPSNVLVSKKGVPKLIDFGVAMFTDRETRTQSGVLKGKFLYMAPEVLVQEAVSHQSDLYALGVILYGLCVGEPAFGGNENVGDRLRGAITRPRTRRPDIPAPLEEIILTTLAAEPSRRYPNGRILASELRGWLQSTGGDLTDEALAAEIAALFPEGPRDWLSSHYDRTSVTKLSAYRAERGPGAWAWLLPGIAAAGVVGAVVVAAVGAAWLAAGQLTAVKAQPEVPTLRAVDPVSSSATALLDEAEGALLRDDLSLAERKMREASLLGDPTQVDRYDRLWKALTVATRIRAVADLLAQDPDRALAAARDLAAEFPNEPRVVELVGRAEERAAGR